MMKKKTESANAVRLTVDGQPISAQPGQTVAAAMIAAGILVFRHTSKKHEPRGVFCGQGVCFDCLVTIDGLAEQRACLTPAKEGMQIETLKEHA